MNRDHDRLIRKHRDRLQVFVRAVREGRGQHRLIERRVGTYVECVTVRWSANQRLDADAAGAAGPVLDDDRVAEVFGNAVAGESGRDIGGAAGGKAYEYADGFGGERLRE